MPAKKSTERKAPAVQSMLQFKATKSGATPLSKSPAVVEPVEVIAPTPQASKSPKKSPKKPAEKKFIKVDSSSEEEEDEIEEPVDEEEKVEEVVSAEEPVKVIKAAIPSATEKGGRPHLEGKKLKELVKTKPFRDQLKLSREKVGGDPVGTAIHEHPALTILRVFDNDDEFGPCVGMKRLERWERAEELGLEPPEIVRQIIIASQDGDDEQVGLDRSVFHDLVF